MCALDPSKRKTRRDLVEDISKGLFPQDFAGRGRMRLQITTTHPWMVECHSRRKITGTNKVLYICLLIELKVTGVTMLMFTKGIMAMAISDRTATHTRSGEIIRMTGDPEMTETCITMSILIIEFIIT